ncbi:MAG: hypothetical protein RR421_04700, partial [Cetobacterium sp.]
IAKVGFTNNEYDYKFSEGKIAYGEGVMRGTNKENQCKLMATGGKFLGVALFRQKNSYDAQEYSDKTTVEILTRGSVYVKVASAVVAGDRAACGLNGKFAKTGTSSYDDIDAEFETSAEAGKYAILRLR